MAPVVQLVGVHEDGGVRGGVWVKGGGLVWRVRKVGERVMLTLLWDAGEGGPGEEHHVGGDEGGRQKVDVGLFYSI